MQLLRFVALRSATSPRWVMIIALFLMVVSIFFAVRLRVSTDISSLMPEHSTISGTLLKSLEDFGTTDRLIVAIEAEDAEGAPVQTKRRQLREKADEVASAMKKTDLFTSVDHKVTSEQRSYFEELHFSHPFHYHSPEKLQDLKNKLSAESINDQVGKLARQLRTTPFGAVSSKQLLRDPLGFQSDSPAPGHMGGFELDISDGYFFSTDGSLVLIIAKPRVPSQDTAFDAKLLEELSGLLAAAGGTGGISPEFSMHIGPGNANAEEPGPGFTVRLLGPYVETLYGSTVAAKEVIPSILVTCLGLLILFATIYRNLRVLLILAVPLALGIVVTSGITSLFVGHLTMITVGFAVMLAGLGVDFGIHLLERIGQEFKPADDIREAISRAFATTGRGVLAGALSTASIFLLIATSDFAALQEFGWIIAMGILLTMISMFCLLPALLVSFPFSLHSRQRAISADWPAWIVSHFKLVIVISAVLTLALGYAASLLKLESNIYELGPINSGYELQKERLLSKAGGSTNVVMTVVKHAHLQGLLELLEDVAVELDKLKANGDIYSFESLHTLLPSQRSQDEVIRTVRAWNLDQAMVNFEQSLQAEGFRTGFFDTFIADVRDYGSTPGKSISLGDLNGTAANDFVDQFLIEQDDGWKAVTYIYPLPGQWEDAIPVEIVSSLEGLGEGITLTGIVPSFGEIAEITRQEFVKLTISALIVVLFISLLFFRRPLISAMSVVPAVFGLVWTLGLMKLFGIELNLITILVAPMIIGIGVDDALHVLNRHRENPAALANTLSAVSGAVLMTTATTIIGFGSLAFADIPSLRSMGITVSIGMVCCAVTSLVLLPALLTAFGDRK